MGSPYSINKEAQLVAVRADYTSAQTGTQLVAADSAYSINVVYLGVSADAAGSAVLRDGTGNIGLKLYYGANNGAFMDVPMVRTGVNKALQITTTASGNHSIYVLYYKGN